MATRRAPGGGVSDYEHSEWVAAIVAAAPPLSDDQRDRIASILRCGSDLAYQPLVERQEIDEQFRHRQELAAEIKRAARDLQACAICGAPSFAHPYDHWKHEWEPNPLALAKYKAE